MVEVKSFVAEIRQTMDWVKWFLGAIAIGILGNIFCQPILLVRKALSFSKKLENPIGAI